MTERIQKVLARSGVASRRKIESLIEKGLVTVNGKVATLGQQIELSDRVMVERRKIRLIGAEQTAQKVIAYHKRIGEVCTRNDPEGRPTVFKFLPKLKEGRWINIGRLDVTTTGLLLFTTDGELANKLMHPSSNIDREYAVRVHGRATPEQLQVMREGVELEDGIAKFTDIVESGGEGTNQWYHVVLMEGKNREVRRIWESQGLQVNRLKRVRFGPIFLTKSIRQGKCIELDKRATKDLLDAVNHQQD